MATAEPGALSPTKFGVPLSPTKLDVPLSPTKLDRQKQERVRTLRKAFCIRKEFPETKIIIDSEGNLNKAYFSLKVDIEEHKWTPADHKVLIEGIQLFGVGRFADIQRELLPKWVCYEPTPLWEGGSCN